MYVFSYTYNITYSISYVKKKIYSFSHFLAKKLLTMNENAFIFKLDIRNCVQIKKEVQKLYKNLRAEMARNRLTVGDLAKALNVRRATVSDKINGKRRFYYEECLKIKKTFFPNLSIEYLFDKDDKQKEVS